MRTGALNSVGLATASTSRESKLEKEVQLYANFMVNRGEETCNAMDPLEFWGSEGCITFPILAGIAARVLSIPATSASVEQLFSISGRIVTNSRTSLNHRHINELCCLHQWLVDVGLVSKEEQNSIEKSAKAFKKFAFLNLRREVETEEPEEDESDEEDDDDAFEND